MKRRLLLRTVDQPTPKFGTWRLLQQENGHAAMHLADANNRYVVSSGHRQAPEGVVRGGRGLQKKRRKRHPKNEKVAFQKVRRVEQSRSSLQASE